MKMNDGQMKESLSFTSPHCGQERSEWTHKFMRMQMHEKRGRRKKDRRGRKEEKEKV